MARSDTLRLFDAGPPKQRFANKRTEAKAPRRSIPRSSIPPRPLLAPGTRRDGRALGRDSPPRQNRPLAGTLRNATKRKPAEVDLRANGTRLRPAPQRIRGPRSRSEVVARSGQLHVGPEAQSTRAERQTPLCGSRIQGNRAYRCP
ncbi:hypothetical protein GN956_G25687 [Arapaima gigas]